MKYIMAAAGLLFSVNGFAIGPDKPNPSPIDDRTVQRLGKQACDSFCKANSSSGDTETCDVQVYGGTTSTTTESTDENGKAIPASATGETLSLSYKVVCR